MGMDRMAAYHVFVEFTVKEILLFFGINGPIASLHSETRKRDGDLKTSGSCRAGNDSESTKLLMLTNETGNCLSNLDLDLTTGLDITCKTKSGGF